jgi:hypothetical protein
MYDKGYSDSNKLTNINILRKMNLKELIKLDLCNPLIN